MDTKQKENPKNDEPTAAEIDQSIIDLENRSEEISQGGNADILLEVDPE